MLNHNMDMEKNENLSIKTHTRGCNIYWSLLSTFSVTVLLFYSIKWMYCGVADTVWGVCLVLFVIFGGLFVFFFYALFANKGLFWYWVHSGILFFSAGVLESIGSIQSYYYSTEGLAHLLFTNTLYRFDNGALFGWLLVILFFYFVVWALFFIDNQHYQHNSLELLFFVNLLFWFFLISLYCFNFLFLFFIMESITLLIVISCVLYIIFFNPQVVQVILQFFVLNVFISIFFLFGSILFLLLVTPSSQHYSLFFFSIYDTYDFWISQGGSIQEITTYYKFFLLFFLITFLFKLTLAPFSIWVVRVYSGLPYLLLIIVMTVYKIVYLFLFLRLFWTLFAIIPTVHVYWTQVVVVFSIISMFIGCFAYKEQDIKTFLAYTTVSQIGYVLLGCASLSYTALQCAILYMLLYCLQIAGLITVLILAQKYYLFTNFQQLYLLRHYNVFYFYFIVLLFFSFLGLPPLSGFFTKFFLLVAVYQAGIFVPAILGVVVSFLMSVIYLQVILQLLWKKEMHTAVLLFETTKKPFFYLNTSQYRVIRIGLHIMLGLVGFVTGGFLLCNSWVWSIVSIIGSVLYY